jgi:hypothetical protein
MMRLFRCMMNSSTTASTITHVPWSSSRHQAEALMPYDSGSISRRAAGQASATSVAVTMVVHLR